MSTSELKMVFVGDCEVGKTTCIERFVKSVFEEEYHPNYSTIIKHLQIHTTQGNKKIFTWDCTGKENVWFRDIHLHGADVVVIMFDVTRRSTYDNVEKWYKLGMKYAPSAQYIICGNKVDKDKFEKFDTTRWDYYFDMSVKLNYNCTEVFWCALQYKYGKEIKLIEDV